VSDSTWLRKGLDAQKLLFMHPSAICTAAGPDPLKPIPEKYVRVIM
jgi:hypothetical protein